MAEAAVSSLLEKLTSIVMQEVLVLNAAGDELEEIKPELESMLSFLKDADRRKDCSEGFRTWKDQVRDVSYDVEDVIDEFVYRARSRRSGFTGFFYNSILLPKTLITSYQFGIQLQAIKTKILSISERKNRYSFDGIEEGSSSIDHGGRWRQRYGESSLFIEDDDVVGIDEARDSLIRWLTDEEQQQRTIISVVGMGGVGKTTVVSKTYKSEVVRKHFGCYAWVSVSQSYRIEELLKCIIKEVYKKMLVMVPNDLDAMNYRELVETLNTFLQQKRYVIVLDDIWSINVWSDLSAAFPDCRCGSRIMVTTRIVDIAFSLCNRSRVYHLQPLDKNNAWVLFCKKAFWTEPSKTCPEELLPLAQTIVDKCDGLPLAIVALGGLMLSRDKTEYEWKKLEVSLSWELNNNPLLERVKSILLLSFNDLPHYLRSCFLYCSAYPEDYEIRRRRLIRQLIAEGFVEECRGLMVEEVADLYLKELVSRSMLQLTEKAAGRIVIRVHDLLRELALQVAEKEKLFAVCDGGNTRFSTGARRLSIHKSDSNMTWDIGNLPLRTFLLFAKDINSLVFPRFKFLRTLDLEGSTIWDIPNELVYLFNLRYFSLKSTNIRTLPESFEKLQNLQTFDVRNTKVRTLPSDLGKLPKLRHLLAGGPIEIFFVVNPRYVSALRAPEGICNLGSTLQSLAWIEADGDFIKQVPNLIELRRFSIKKVQAIDGIRLCTAIQKMNHLRSLFVMATNEDEALRLESLSNPTPLLQKLWLFGHLETLPPWINSLRNLTHLALSWSGLIEDPISSICALPNLVSMFLGKVFVGERLHFRGGGFPRLRRLYLLQFMQMNQFVVEDGAMPQLQRLFLGTCPELKMPPMGIEYLSCLQELLFMEMPEELIQGLQTYYSQHQRDLSRIPIFRRVLGIEGKAVFESIP